MGVCAHCGADLPDDARFCPACAAPVEEDRSGEERKLATVLFADLVGSTELGGAQDPERTRALLERFYDAAAQEVEQAGGTVEKFAGDAVMAAFGAPASLEDHAERALHAALAMLHRVRDVDERLELRIGVNTGEVVAGRPREGSSFVTGDPVNVAARLEQGAEPGEILVGDRTVASTRGAFEFGDERAIDAKGKQEGVGCRPLLRALSLMRPRGVGGLRRAFVGRDHELGRLLAAHRETVAEGRPQMVTIVGDAGVGKTRLVRELWELLAEESPEPQRRTGRCLPYGQAITFWPLAEMLKEQYGIRDSDPPEVVLERLGEQRLLGLTLGLDVAEGTHPLLVRDRFQDAWSKYLGRAAAERPLVMLVEDLHWAEDQLLDLLERLVEGVDGPLLLIATARPELLDRRPGWGARGPAETIELEALSAEDSVRLLDELLAGGLPERLREVVVERAEGNPFFVEELLATLIDTGLLRPENGGWTLEDLPADLSIPDSVQAVLAARIDLLEPAEKEALQAAAVIGRVFWSGPVYELVQGQPDLRVLEERDFIRRRVGSSMAGEREYAIKHALTREVAYETVSKARRARLHATFAGWVERTGGGRDELAPLLAHHYAEAVRPDDADLAWSDAENEAAPLRAKAVTWLARAAELARSRYELEDAIALYQRAIELEGDRTALATLWHELGRSYGLHFEGERLIEAMLNAIELTDDPVERAAMYADLALNATGRSGMWPTAPDEELVEGWIDRALAGSPPDSEARIRTLLAQSFWRPAAEDEPAREASLLADRLGDPDLRGLALSARALAAFGRGDFQTALTWAERAGDLVEEMTDPDLVADAYGAAVPAVAALGRVREAERLAQQYYEVNERLTPHHRVHGVALPCEVAELWGDWRRIIELEPEVVERVEDNLDTPCVRNARTLLLCALAHVYDGDDGAARELEGRARELWMEGHGIVLDAALLKLALARDDLDEVERLCSSELTLRRQTWFYVSAITARFDALAAIRRKDELEETVAAYARPKTVLEPYGLRALGIVREDPKMLAQAADLFESMRLDWHAEQTRKLVAQA
jgi:class 3 adenylate cyclase/tetratricopeptide (TPR) repeat protein